MAKARKKPVRTPRERIGVDHGTHLSIRHRLKPLAELVAADVPRGMDPEDVSIEHSQFHREPCRDD